MSATKRAEGRVGGHEIAVIRLWVYEVNKTRKLDVVDRPPGDGANLSSCIDQEDLLS